MSDRSSLLERGEGLPMRVDRTEVLGFERSRRYTKEERREKNAWVVLSVRMDLNRAGGSFGRSDGNGTETESV